MPLVIKRNDLARVIYLLELVVVNAPDPVDVEDAKRLIELFEVQLLGM